MSSGFSLRSHRDRYRQKSREKFFRNLLLIGFLVGIFVAGYHYGARQSQNKIRNLKFTVQELQTEHQSIQEEIITLRANNQTLTIKNKELTERYNRDIPKGDLGLLSALAQEQLKKGINVERLAFVIRQAQPPQNCTNPEKKRFILKTPIYKGPQSSVSFANGAITITGSGEATITETGQKEAWFDAGKPVIIKFTKLGGKADVKESLLPIHHTIILGDREHRFTVAKGPRSFVTVTTDSCDYTIN